MGGFQQVSPEQPGYAADCRRIAMALQGARAVYVTLEARATKLRVLLANTHTLVAFGAPDVEGTDWLAVAIIGHGAYWFQLGTYLSPGYVAEKLAINFGDGETVAEFLMRLASETEIS